METLDYIQQIISDLFKNNQNQTVILLAVFGGIILSIIKGVPKWIWNLLMNKKEKGKSIWKFELSAQKADPLRHFFITNYSKTFIASESFKKAMDISIKQNNHLILAGIPGIGKTRTAFELRGYTIFS